MKRFFVLFLSLIFVLSIGAFAVADDGGQNSVRSMKAGSSVIIGGDARVRGVWQKEYDMNNGATTRRTNDADRRYWDQRVRLNITGNVGSGIEVRTRLTTGDDHWDGAANTNGTVNVDYAYLHIPVSGLIIDAGRLKRNWGNKLLVWDTSVDSFQMTAQFGPVEVSGYTDKVNDTSTAANALANNAGVENLNDYNNNAIYVNYKADAVQAGLIYAYQDDNTTVGDDRCGSNIGVYANAKAGPIAIASEYVYKGGALNADTEAKAPNAGFINATANVGKASVSGTFAMAKNGYVADTHFTPTVFIGTDNPTAIANFMAENNSSTRAYILGASVNATADLSVNGKLAYMLLENLGTNLGGRDTGDERATEIDLGVGYKLASNAKYTVDFGYWMPDDIIASDDNAMALAHKIEVSF